MSLKCLRCGADSSWIDGNKRADSDQQLAAATARAERAEAALAQEYADWAETDTKVREVLTPVDGSNSFGTMCVAELAERAAADCRTLANALRRESDDFEGICLTETETEALTRWLPTKEKTNY